MHRPQINFPDPWPGGSWRLRDIVDYDLSAVEGLLQAVSAYRETIVQNFYEMGRRAVDLGRQGGPFAFIIPQRAIDKRAVAKLEELLMQGSIEIHRALEPFRADGDPYPEGTDIILLAQPYRACRRHCSNGRSIRRGVSHREGPPERPYDVAGWTLPQQMGIDVRLIERTFQPPAMQRLSSATITPAKVSGRATGGLLRHRRTRQRRRRRCKTGSQRQAGWCRGCPVNSISTASATSRAHSSCRSFKGIEPVVAQIATELGLRADGGRAQAAGRCAADRAIAHRTLQAVGREHRRRLDAVDSRAARIPLRVDHRRRDPRWKSARGIRRDRSPRARRPNAWSADIRKALCHRRMPEASAILVSPH